MGIESFGDKMSEINSTHDDREDSMKFDPDKRMERNENKTCVCNSDTEFDPDKRIDTNENSIIFNDNEAKSAPDTENQGKIDLTANYEQKSSTEQEIKSVEVNVPEKIKCRNEELAGKYHPDTGVFFEKKIIEVYEKLYEVVVPQFESIFNAQLPEDKLKETDAKQFRECNVQLKEAIINNEKLREKFDDDQLEQIENGETPDGYTWHHDAEVGKMQLVDTETHQKTGHTGGRVIWGSGTENR